MNNVDAIEIKQEYLFDMETVRVGDTFRVSEGEAQVSQCYSKGFHYHTLDAKGNCIIGERYMTHKEYGDKHHA